MDSQWLIASSISFFVAIVSIGLFWVLRSSPIAEGAQKPPSVPTNFPEPAPYIQRLALALPDCIIFPQNVAAFGQAMNGYWTQQNRETIPACIVRPRNAQDVSTAIAHIKRQHAERAQQPGRDEGLFAIRSGGANPAYGISGVKDGVVFDLSLICEVTPSEDGSNVVVGAGAYWRDVYEILDKKGLAVAGGRSSPVGVGGSTLQGGMSFYSPQYGFICSNVISYEVVLADGSIVNASAKNRSDLWRALKGGGNNFGIITHFTLRAFPGGDVWAGSYLSPGFLATQNFTAIYDYAKRAGSGEPNTFDEYASTPIISLTYVNNLGFSLFHHHLAYTKPRNGNDWPEYWKKSSFNSLWRFRSRVKVGSLHSAVKFLGDMSPAGHRNVYGTTTIKNDLKTIFAAHTIWKDSLQSVKHVKDSMFIIIMQVVLPQWAKRGDPNMLGLQDCTEPLIIVSFAVDWRKSEDDELFNKTVRCCIERIEEAAEANNASHPFRFHNYASDWQQTLKGCGPENMKFMQDVSEKYDPDGLFQTGCLGGFKLDVPAEKE